MSKQGEWRTMDGVTMRISAMDTPHLRNSLRYMYRKIARPPVFVPTNETPPVANTWRSNTSTQYYEDKFVELGDEAQNRNLVPNPCTFEQLLTIVGEWEREAVASKAAWQRAQGINNAPTLPVLNTNAILAETVARRATAPPSTIGIYLDVAEEVTGIIKQNLKVVAAKVKSEKVERNISFEL